MNDEKVTETCPSCGWKFKAKTYAETREMLRQHMNTEHRLTAILVADVKEAMEARDAGWGHDEIIVAERSKIEGRRYHDLHITWSAMYEKWSGEIAALLHRNQSAMDATINIVCGIPKREEIK